MHRDERSVGCKYPEWATNNVLIQANFSGGLWELVVGFPEITKEEVHELQMGDFQMTFAYINSALFLLFKVGKMAWCDSPFEPRFYNPPQSYDLIEAGMGAPLLLYSVDTTTGELKAIRMMGLGNVLTNKLHTLCSEIDAKRPINMEKYHYAVNRVYSKYPTSDAMLKEVNPQNIFMLITNEE